MGFFYVMKCIIFTLKSKKLTHTPQQQWACVNETVIVKCG